MYVIKRDGSQVHFDAYKICEAINKANNAYEGSDKLSPKMIDEIVEKINYKCSKLDRAVSVEEIQDMVEDCIMSLGRYRLAKEYITYRYKHALMRKSNDLDRKILNLIDCKNEEVLQENSNKNPTINSTQRDYIAGEYSKDISNRLLLPEDIQKAHNEGLIHFHDMDYFIQKMHNCCLINLEDMLQNGTVISETKIDTPHSFTTACNIATQIIAQVASSQYGGATISLAHLAPFVDVSRKKIINNIKEELEISGATLTEEQIKEIAEERLKREIKSGIQTIQYQIVTLMTTNGQAPFITESMYLNEAKNEQEKHDLAMIIEETLRQRYKGTKNKQGVYVTPTFPKLIYVLQDDNIHEGDEYYYLTIMAAQCTAKRMVPDYISEKKMKELKEGTVVIPMGAVFGKEVITYKLNNQLFVESFERTWDRLVSIYGGSMIKLIGAKSEFIVPENMLIFDSSSNGFVKVKKFIRNDDYNRWNRVKFNGRVLTLTSDHPLPTQRGRIAVEDLKPGDTVPASKYEKESDFSKEYTVESVEFLGNIGEYEYDVETESDRFDVSGINSHNCRSMLSPWKDENGNYKYWGRFNMGVVTLNIPYVALSSKGDKEVFWKKFDEALELVHKALLVRYNRLKGTTSDYAPILWQHGALSRLKPGETIDKLLVGGYATISLGYAGLYEAVRYMTGKSHTDPEATPFALDIMKRMNEKCKEWKEKENLGYAIYGTPLESTTYKFAKANQRRFGVIEGVTDKPYVTNSYHVHVTEPISIFDKFNFESQFQELSTGGAISYGESPSMLNNIEAIMKVLSYIYDHILYAEINSKSDYCYKCGYEGEIKLDKNEETGEMVWTCPNCGNHDPKEMSIVRRTCGYLGNNMWNYGRTNEIHDRVLHL
jgi:anaerobic ribonucleoside-triphosphate reductase